MKHGVRASLRCVLSQGVERLARSSSTAQQFAHDPSGIPPHVLLRHTAEHVFRIRMFRDLDVLAHRFLRESRHPCADLWAGYARSESLHDRYFMRDLNAIARDRP